MSASDQLARNYAEVEEAICHACRKSGRQRCEVQLLAVSKGHSAADILALARLGQTDFGENYIQEARSKMDAPEFKGAALNWHMIGHIQHRKASRAAGAFALVHSLDSPELADSMERNLQMSGLIQPVLIEVNVGDEPQKSGVDASSLSGLALHIRERCPRLNLRGLMCIPPSAASGEGSRPYFARLRELGEKLESELGEALPHLSMGMSGDFTVAIEEGATIVRVGTRIFGPRQPRRVT